MFAKRAALDIENNWNKNKLDHEAVEKTDLGEYQDVDALEETYTKLVQDAIDAANNGKPSGAEYRTA